MNGRCIHPNAVEITGVSRAIYLGRAMLSLSWCSWGGQYSL